jgi:hypothetical protein
VRKTVRFGADIVMTAGSPFLHVVVNAYAEDASAWRGQTIPCPHDPRRLWQAATTVCGRVGPWQYNDILDRAVDTCAPCHADAFNAIQSIPDRFKIAAGWIRQGDLWSAPPKRRR